MSRTIGLGQNNFRLLYYRYKDSAYFSLAVFVVIISVCITLFFSIVVPQMQDFLSITNEAARTRERISNIEKNINFMNNLDKSVLGEQFGVATNAVPFEKNFGAIINALSDSAVSSGISLDDFAFQVGDVASTEGKLNVYGQKDLSTLIVTLTTTGGVSGIDVFLKEIQEKLPISEATIVDGDSLSTNITLQFYQKKLPQIVFKDDELISPLSAEHLNLLDELYKWQPAIPQDVEVGTGSAGSVPLF